MDIANTYNSVDHYLKWPGFDCSISHDVPVDGRLPGCRGSFQNCYPHRTHRSTGGTASQQIKSAVIGASTVVRLRTWSRQRFRRSWATVRDEGSDVVALCFVRRGSMRVAHAAGANRVKPGDLVALLSKVPFEIETTPSADGGFDVLYAIVPAHMLVHSAGRIVEQGLVVPAGGRGLVAIERMLSVLVEQLSNLPESVCEQLLGALLPVAFETVAACANANATPKALSDQRLADVLRHVETHLSDPRLSARTVARSCGISPRYLSALLSRHGTSFPTLLWTRRLQTAERWLTSRGKSRASISEIAFRVGFKSLAHFSRMFRRQYGMAPSAYRTERSSGH